MPDALSVVARAVDRATQLLTVLDRQHTVAELHERARAIRHELKTAQEAFSALGADVVAPMSGKVRGDAPETSRAAARAIRTRSGSQRHQLLALLVGGAYADWQLQSIGGIGASSERPRRLELVEAGYIEAARDDDGKLITRKHPHSGLDCQVWRATAKGRAALAQLDAGQMALAFPEGA